MSAPHIDNKRPAAYNADNPEKGHRVRPGESALLHTAVGTSLRREVRLMGDGQRAKALRFLICFIIVLVIMVYISPKVR